MTYLLERLVKLDQEIYDCQELAYTAFMAGKEEEARELHNFAEELIYKRLELQQSIEV